MIEKHSIALAMIGTNHGPVTNPRHRADYFLDPEVDPRQGGSRHGDERATLTEFLRRQRLTLQLKCEGLDPAQLGHRAVEPSTMSLLGLMRHMAEVERTWFRRRFAGLDVPKLYQSGEEPDGDFDGATADQEVVNDAWAKWRAEVAFAEQLATTATRTLHPEVKTEFWKDSPPGGEDRLVEPALR